MFFLRLSQAVNVDGLRIRALVDLWAFGVAHSDATALKAAQGELRDILRRALPLFDHLSQSGSVRDLAIVTPVGPIGLASASRSDVIG